MTDATALPLESVSGLVEERERYLAWIAQLEARRESTPAHVYERVRSDYERRLDAVIAQIAGHAAELQTAIDRLAARVRDLQEAESRRNDERCEAELRASVGEYTMDRWEAIRAEVDAELARLAEQRAEAQAELEKLEQLMAIATPRSVEAVPEPQPAAEQASPAVADAVDVTSLLAPAAPPEPPPAPPASHEPPAPAPAAESPSPAAGGRTAPLDELEFLKSVIQPTGNYPAVPAEGQQAAGANGQPLAWPGDIADATRDLAPRNSNSAIANGLREGAATEPIKTLRCQECGTMNYPTEWYCERCGGELAAL